MQWSKKLLAKLKSALALSLTNYKSNMCLYWKTNASAFFCLLANDKITSI